MTPSKLEISGIDVGMIAAKIDSMAGFKAQPWDEHLESVLTGIRALKPEIVAATAKLSKEIGRENSVGHDGPTDIMWMVSMVLAARTIGMLSSKSQDPKRTKDNRDEHVRLLRLYCEDLQEIIRKSEDCAKLFPH